MTISNTHTAHFGCLWVHSPNPHPVVLQHTIKVSSVSLIHAEKEFSTYCKCHQSLKETHTYAHKHPWTKEESKRKSAETVLQHSVLKKRNHITTIQFCFKPTHLRCSDKEVFLGTGADCHNGIWVSCQNLTLHGESVEHPDLAAIADHHQVRCILADQTQIQHFFQVTRKLNKNNTNTIRKQYWKWFVSSKRTGTVENKPEHTCPCLNIHTYRHTCMWVNICTHTQIPKPTCMWAHTHTRVYGHTHVYLHTNINAYTHAHTQLLQYCPCFHFTHPAYGVSLNIAWGTCLWREKSLLRKRMLWS